MSVEKAGLCGRGVASISISGHGDVAGNGGVLNGSCYGQRSCIFILWWVDKHTGLIKLAEDCEEGSTGSGRQGTGILLAVVLWNSTLDQPLINVEVLGEIDGQVGSRRGASVELLHAEVVGLLGLSRILHADILEVEVGSTRRARTWT